MMGHFPSTEEEYAYVVFREQHQITMAFELQGHFKKNNETCLFLNASIYGMPKIYSRQLLVYNRNL